MSSSAPSPIAFTSDERRASVSLAGVIGLRMLGLFLMLPVLSVGARDLEGGENVVWVGVALGVYGLTQALLQIPFGLASDRWGRRPVIVFGLIVFALGSVWAALAPSVEQLVIARALQGAGAVSAAVSAFLADRTRPEVRARAMAMVGASIGLSFALSLLVAPLVFGRYGLPGLFGLTASLACLAAVVVWSMRESSDQTQEQTGSPLGWRGLLRHDQLMRLNFGIFSMMVLQTAMFVAIPTGLMEAGLAVSDHWVVYLPMLLLAFAAMVPLVFWAERRGIFRRVFLMGLAILLASVMAFVSAVSLPHWFFALWLFLVGFNLLEALLPSWVSRIAPVSERGLALGLYTTSQSLGLFLGGLLGGVAARWFGLEGVFWGCSLVLICWMFVAKGQVEIGSRAAPVDPRSTV
ncbi:MAG: MFS transporter [Betaproteobacteria bacterium]|nr:MFS transporter [Betaproteobacteria bacterium]